jgi:hypothetical protein
VPSLRASIRRPGARARIGAVLTAIAATGYVSASAAAAPLAPVPDTAGSSALLGRGLPAPVLEEYPPNPTYASSALLTYSDARPDVSFHCYLNVPPAALCTGGRGRPGRRSRGEQRYSGLTIGVYCFYVYATARTRSRSRTTQYCWTVLGRPVPYRRHHRQRLLPVTVGGDLAMPLLPGVSESIDLTFANPNPVPVTIASGGISAANITITTAQPGCMNSWFVVTQGLAADITIPARQSTPVSLSDLLVPQSDWPVVEMVDTDTNQDACEGATLTLTYSGIEVTG